MDAKADGPSLTATNLLFVVLAAAPFFIDYSARLHSHVDLPQKTAAAVGTALVLAFVAVRAARREAPAELTLTPWHAALAGFLLWCGLTGLWARSGLEWWGEWRPWLLAGAAGAAAAATGGRLRQEALWVFFASAVAEAALGLLQYFEVSPFSLILQSVPPAGTFGHRSFSTYWMALGIPAGTALWVRSERPREQWGAALGLGLIAGLAILAAVRASWLALLAEAMVLPLWVAWEHRRGALAGRHALRWGSAAAGLALALALAAATDSARASRYGSYGERISAMVEGLSGEMEVHYEGAAIPANAVRMRLAIWQNSLGIVARRPLRGVGLGNFRIFYPWFGAQGVRDGVDDEVLIADHAHNDVVELLVDTGAVGLLLALLIAAACAAPWLGLARSVDPWDRALAWGLGTGLLGLFVNAQFCMPAHRALPPLAVALFMGVIVGRNGGRRIVLSPSVIKAVAGMLVAASFIVLLDSARRLEAERLFSRAHGIAYTLAPFSKPPPNIAVEEWERRQSILYQTALDLSTDAESLVRDPRFAYTRGALLVQMQRADEGIAVLIPFVHRHPNHMRALINLALALAAKGRGAEAVQAAARAVEVEPKSSRAHNALGFSLLAKGDLAASAEAFARAGTLDPTNAAYPKREAEVRARLGTALKPAAGRR